MYVYCWSIKSWLPGSHLESGSEQCQRGGEDCSRSQEEFIIGENQTRSSYGIWIERMKHRLDVELDFITDLSPVELASRIAPIVREVVEAMRQSLGCEPGV